MFSILGNMFKIEDLRKKLLYVLLILFVYRIGANMPLPGVDIGLWMFFRSGFTGDTLFATIAGGGFATLFAMGIGPYITASIIMQLLTVAVPSLEQLKKEGQSGQQKIEKITRYLALVMALFQSIGMIFTFSSMGLFIYPNLLTYAIAVLSMIAGSMMVMWLGELITEKGVGNGVSFMIFANILSALPGAVMGMWNTMLMGDILMIIIMVALVLLFLGLIVFAIIVQDGERRIPVQNSKKMVGQSAAGNNQSYIPLKVNIAGVMSIIFALSLLQFPALIQSVVTGNEALNTVVYHLALHRPIGAALYVILIVAFTFFYTSFAMNPAEMAENMKKNGSFIPGIRPGKPTTQFIEATIHRLSSIGACFYVILAITPIAFQWITMIWVEGGVQVGFGGTTLLIVVGVALEIVKQLESNMLVRHYKGFLN